MIENIYFCADGILRSRGSENKPLIPLLTIQNILKEDDITFWFKNWNSTIHFENGLTLCKFLQNIEPWVDFFSKFTGVHLSEYLQEVKKPSLIKKDTSIDWIGIEFVTDVDADVEYERSLDEKEDFLAWINSPKASRLSGKFNIDSHYKITGYKFGENEHYSIDHTPLNQLANCEVFLDPNQYVIFSNFHYKKHLNTDFISDNAYGFIKHYDSKVMVGEKFHRLKDVIEAFFWWMPATIQSREDFIQNLKDISDSIPLEVLGETKHSEDTDTDDTKKDKKLEVKVMPGAFDSLIEHSHREKDFWDYIFENSKKDKSSILKLGKLSEQIVPETRLFNKVKTKEELTILPTDYKMKE